jgi:DNA processing protein
MNERSISEIPAASGSRPYADRVERSVLEVAFIEQVSAVVALMRRRPAKLTWPDIAIEVLEAGSAVEVWNRHVPAAMIEAPGEVTPTSVQADVQRWISDGVQVVPILDRRYPERLKGVHQAPPLVFAKGSLVADDVGFCVVGSRESSDRGRATAAAVARELVDRQLAVVSGLARGIDTAAHRAALDAGGRTVAVIGNGITRTYPAENAALQGEIADKGLVLSQFWPETPPQKHTFLERNATMSGYGLATIVVEAGEQSGARAQARIAVEHGRQVILTDEVVTRNEWAREMVGRAGVHTAGSVGTIMSAVDEIVAMWDELRIWMKK